jgi:hypothetical protein
MNKYSTYVLYADGVHTKLGDNESSVNKFKVLVCGEISCHCLCLYCKLRSEMFFKKFRFLLSVKFKLNNRQPLFSGLWQYKNENSYYFLDSGNARCSNESMDIKH